MRKYLKLLVILVMLTAIIQPTMANGFSIYVYNAYTGHSVSVARVDICDAGGSTIEWGYTDSYGNYQTNLDLDENYLIKASYGGDSGSRRIRVDMFTPNVIEVGIR